MKEYSLVVTFKNKNTVIFNNTIEEIDNLIFKIDAYNAADLFEVFNSFTDLKEGEYNFKIVNKEGKEKHLIYKSQINKVRSLDNSIIKNKLFEKMLIDSNFRTKFFKEFVFPLKNINNNLGIKTRNLIYKDIEYFNALEEGIYHKITRLEKDFRETFYAFYNSLIFTSKNDRIVENYSKKRMLLNFYCYSEKGFPSTTYNYENLAEDIFEADEFDEQMIYDNNPDISCIRNFGEEEKNYYETLKNQEKSKIKVKKKEQNKILPYYQQSLLDDE